MKDVSKRVNILSSPIDVLTMEGTLNVIDESILNNKKLRHVVVNAAKLVNMQKDKELYDSVVSCDLINADGQSVVWASHFLGKPLPARVAGIDLMERLVELAYKKGYKVFFFGAQEEIVKRVVEVYSKKYSPRLIAGYKNGHFPASEEPEIVERISKSNAHILFVAISSPKKEIFLRKYESLLNIPFVMGVGGSFDVIAGITKRAPVWMQKSGMEWFYRFLQEPGRMWKRYLITNSLFILYVLKEKIKSGRK